RNFLAAEIVDHEHAGVGLPLQRRLVVAVLRVICQVELLELELASGGHDRALHPDEPAVDRLLALGHLVVHGVDHADDLVAKRDCVWDHPDRKSTRLNSSHGSSSYAVFCLKKQQEELCLACRHQACKGCLRWPPGQAVRIFGSIPGATSVTLTMRPHLQDSTSYER